MARGDGGRETAIGHEQTERAIERLAAEFSDLDLSFHEMPGGQPGDVTSFWPGGEGRDVVVCAFKGSDIAEPFHRQDFFFINYAYRGGYDALSAAHDNLISVREGELYVGQPYSGYALRSRGGEEAVILGVLIRKDAFFREYLPVVYADAGLFRFFLDPRRDRFSDEFIHLSLPRDHAVRQILEMMAVEYVDAQPDGQRMLKSMLQTLLLQISRRYRIQLSPAPAPSVSGRIIAYMDDHSDAVTLASVARRFGYHPNYVSGLIHRETGRTFSRILLEKRMGRAALLLGRTGLSVEEIATMLGYGDQSNFYKAFKAYYGVTPREYAAGADTGQGSDG